VVHIVTAVPEVVNLIVFRTVYFVGISNTISPVIGKISRKLCVLFKELCGLPVLTCYELDTYPSLEGCHCVVIEVQDSHLILLLSQHKEELQNQQYLFTKRCKCNMYSGRWCETVTMYSGRWCETGIW
jgi:hypothetical protein